MHVIEATDLTKDFDGVRALDRVSFAVGPGEVFGLVGPNGAGKTTLLRILTDILRPDSGTLALFGSVAHGTQTHLIGYMPEERGLYRNLTPLEVVAYFGELRGLTRRDARARAEAALEAVGMWGHARRRLDELSKGMAQRVQFASTIVHRPRLLILDEPFTGLDPVSARHLRTVVSEARSDGTTVILSTHNMDHAEKLCDRMLMLHRGHVRLYGDVSRIKDDYTDGALRVEHLGALPEIDRARTRRIDDGTSLVEPLDGLSRRGVLSALVGSGADIVRFEPVVPSLEDIFIRVVGEEGQRALNETRQAVLSSEA